jgi:hypothetical protein
MRRFDPSIKENSMTTFLRVLIASFICFALWSAPASAFTGTKSLDAESGDFSAFTGIEVERGSAPSVPSATVVSSAVDPAHVAQGRFSFRYDMPAGGRRIEHAWSYSGANQFREGDDVWIAQQIHLDPRAWAEQGWNAGHHIILQIKSADAGRGGPFAMDDRDNRWTWGPRGATELISQPVTKGVWERWLYHFRFSSNPAAGRITIIKNGVTLYDAARATLYPGYGAYFKQGIYQNTAIKSPSRLWIDGTTISVDRTVAARGAWGG